MQISLDFFKDFWYNTLAKQKLHCFPCLEYAKILRKSKLLDHKEVFNTMMKKYELYYIIDASATEEEREALINKISEFVTNNGGTIDGLNREGLKKLAYPINFKSEGYYVLMNFTSAPELPAELEKQMLIMDHYVRGLILAK